MKHVSVLFLFVLLPALLTGCGFGGRPLRIEPVANKAAAFEPRFGQVYYRVDRDQNVYFYLKADSAKGASDQTILFRVFWQPIGGRTTLNAAAINATYRYVVLNSTGAGMYEGTGFVRFSGKVGSPRLKARLIDGDLRLTESTSGFVDTLKRSRIRGTFTAKRDDARTVEQTLEAQRTYFARTFAEANKSAAAATAPDATPPADTQPATGPTTAP